MDANVLSERRVRDHLSELSMQGVLNVNERNTGIHGGSYYEYEISVDLAAVLDVLLDIDRLEARRRRWSSRRSAATSSIPNPLILSGSDGLSTGSGNTGVWQCLLRVKDSVRRTSETSVCRWCPPRVRRSGRGSGNDGVGTGSRYASYKRYVSGESYSR